MAMRKFLIVITLFTVYSCDNNEGQSEPPADSTVIIVPGRDTTQTVQNGPPPNASGCYVKVLGRDTMVVQLVQNGNELSGKMTFDNYQKDGSSGRVSGRVDGNTAKLWYDFHSEGMNSVMEIWFRIGDEQLIRGIGSFGTKGDTAYYTNKPDIQYPDDQSFPKVECTKVPAKYVE